MRPVPDRISNARPTCSQLELQEERFTWRGRPDLRRISPPIIGRKPGEVVVAYLEDVDDEGPDEDGEGESAFPMELYPESLEPPT
jgi:hypothetical protein